MDRKVPRETREKFVGSTQVRQIEKFHRKSIDEENQIIPISISSEAPVRRFFGDEVLVLSKTPSTGSARAVTKVSSCSITTAAR